MKIVIIHHKAGHYKAGQTQRESLKRKCADATDFCNKAICLIVTSMMDAVNFCFVLILMDKCCDTFMIARTKKQTK